LNLTERTDVKFYNEDWDQPGAPPSYGVAGWMEYDNGVMIYDKYDIWKFGTEEGSGFSNLTAADGRIGKTTFKIINLNPDKKYFGENESFILSGYNEKTKSNGIFGMEMRILGPFIILRDSLRYNVLQKAKNFNRLLFTRESMEEFPDLCISDSTFKKIRKISDVNPQINDFLWYKPELMKWKSIAGDSLEGILVKPENYDPNKKYPVIVYIYEKMSQTYNFFKLPVISHTPCIPVYTGDGYLMFYPDIKYKIGEPGKSALDCILPGLQMLADKGIIDTNAIGLNGHSWGGYQTVYSITQTNKFSAAVAGAAVGNMTSAYNGIRLESGLAREMQYEKEQSRIGGTLWDSLGSFIENSPVFKAKGIKTPLLVMFGDEDSAVPWYQGIEIYLSLRRLQKNCILLEYRSEPHIPRKYPNRLDYALKTKQFYDHYLKGMDAPDWITKGVEYRGK
jgi:dipeptidyl aminopeptidase/acylaminoacyl peptidase